LLSGHRLPADKPVLASLTDLFQRKLSIYVCFAYNA
jgi:hypothetical protein